MEVLEPRTRRWTKDEYYRMAELGWFEGERVELVLGEIIVMTPQNFAHVVATLKACKALEGVFGQDAWVRTQMPLDLGAYSNPEPDVSVVSGRLEDYSEHPKSALLVVEVSDTTLAYDRLKKARMHADAGILEYWIINLVDHRLEVHRDPVPGGSGATEGLYQTVFSLTASDLVSPLAALDKRIPVAELLGAKGSA
jgi:Uma2 family endonuclease